jgi:hypothetical protein
MPVLRLTRRASLLLPFLLAACGGEPKVYPPLRYDYLKPIDLSVKAIELQTRFVPSGKSPDISRESPVDPLATLHQMLEDRLKALGSQGRAVVSISDASLTEAGDQIRCSMDVKVEIVGDDGQQLGYVRVPVTRTHTGHIGDKQELLHDMISGVMDEMNIELEHQIRTNLKNWLAEEVTAVPGAVDATPLAAPRFVPPPPR